MPFVWPFTSQSAAQNNRVDQGWDLQGVPGSPLIAVDSGTVKSASDPRGFGPSYPLLILDNPPPGAPSNTVYYGHTDVDPNLIGKHVNRGEVIGRTSTTGHNASPGWLEIGFAQSGTGAPVQKGEGATGAGQAMKNLLTGVPISSGVITGGGNTATLVSSGDSGCLAKLPLLGCIISHSQAKSLYGGLLIAGGIVVSGLGIWMVMGKPGEGELKSAAKLAVLA